MQGGHCQCDVKIYPIKFDINEDDLRDEYLNGYHPFTFICNKEICIDVIFKS